MIETVKRADRGDGLIVRLYESFGGRRRVRLRTAFPLGAAMRTDLLERPIGPAALVAGEVELLLAPFEVVTLLLTS